MEKLSYISGHHEGGRLFRHRHKEVSKGVVHWLNRTKDTIASGIISFGKELKALHLTSAWATGAVGIAAGIGLTLGARSFRKWRKEHKGGTHGGGGH